MHSINVWEYANGNYNMVKKEYEVAEGVEKISNIDLVKALGYDPKPQLLLEAGTMTVIVFVRTVKDRTLEYFIFQELANFWEGVLISNLADFNQYIREISTTISNIAKQESSYSSLLKQVMAEKPEEDEEDDEVVN